MRILAPPPRHPADELEALIREARERQLRRRLLGAAAVAIGAAIGLGVYGLLLGSGSRHAPTARAGAGRGAVEIGSACGVRVSDLRIVDSAGRTLYREPGSWTPSHPHPSVVRCAGSSVWVVWDNGAAMNQEGYVGVHSGDGGRTWRLVFAESYFGVNAPHELGSYLGPWTVPSPGVAYFSGWCPACSPGQWPATVWVWVTRDAGRSFTRYPVEGLSGYRPTVMRVSGARVTLAGRAAWRGEPARRTATIRIP